MSLRQILENLTRDTWQRLRDARSLDIQFGEETITSLLLLELKKEATIETTIIQTSKNLEKSQGTDWEWWVGSDRIGWVQYAIQAKRLDKDMRYGTIKHKIHNKLQIELLKEYSLKNNAIALYCFYNYAEQGIDSTAWHCSLPYDQEQLACTIASISTAQSAIDGWGQKSFKAVHSYHSSLPLRCIACPRMLRQQRTHEPTEIANRVSVFGSDTPNIYERLPEPLLRARDRKLVDEVSEEFYNRQTGMPANILILESNEIDEPDA